MKSAINKTFDTLTATLESRRAHLLTKAESKCNGHLKEVWAQKEQVHTMMVGLKSALGFTQRAIQCNDVEMLSLSAQAVFRLKQLEEAKWDPSVVGRVENTALHFTVGEHTAYLQKIGKLDECTEKGAQSLELTLQNLPQYIELGKKRDITISAHTKIHKLGFHLMPGSFEIKVSYGKSKKQVTLQAGQNLDGSWTFPFAATCGGPHSIIVTLKDSQTSTKKQYTFQTSVTGKPAVGARVRRGPDWDYADEDGGDGNVGTVITNNNAGDYCLTVKWESTSENDYRWGKSDSEHFDVEVV